MILATSTLPSDAVGSRSVALRLGLGAAVMTTVLASYQFFYLPMTAEPGSAEALAFNQLWPVFALYILALGVVVLVGMKAVLRSIDFARPSRGFSLACITAACAGIGMSVAIGEHGIGGEVIVFYWAGLAVLWIGSILMLHICAYQSKPLAVRDWTIYAYAMGLIPLTMVPSIPLWPIFFELDAHQTLMTAVTSSFAAHVFIAHYVIFEILEKHQPTP